MATTVRRFAADEWRTYRELRLRALAEAPDSFGSTHEREAARADTEWEERLHAGTTAKTQCPIVALVDEMPVGLAWGRLDEHEATLAHLFQVWVSPPYRGQGIGRLLTNAVIGWARDLGICTLRLGVTASDPAAFQLYRHAGFVNAGRPEPLRPGSPVLCQPMELALKPTSQIGRPNER
jgi:GNAT superfamily N-acetyltransferase